MPTYEYACSSCKRRFEVVQSFSDAPLSVCEVCGGELKRVFHPVGILLKGSGFYSTDNRSSKSLAPGKGSEEKGAGDKASGEKKAGDKKSSGAAKPTGSEKSSSSSDAAAS